MAKRAWIIVLVSGLPLISPQATFGNETIKRQFMRLDPATRVEQACGWAVQQRINEKERDEHVDRIVSYSFADFSIHGQQIRAPGAAIRSHGKWYHLSFNCRTDETLVNVDELEFSVGDEVPRSLWSEHYLHD
ncbi:hypothetical protein N185_16100 [Sinorhizobium sp. GW3]|nr:hypothetical protein N185_16100 [Sinorhizobium sp. GW3]